MTRFADTAYASPAAQARALVEHALELVLGPGAGIVPTAADKNVQDALRLLRDSDDRDAIARVERISVTMFAIDEARRAGRPNLHASKLLRLRQLAGARP